MPSPFAVTAASNSVSLDAKRHGEAAFTAFNSSGRPIRGRARLVPQNAEANAWLSLAGVAERDFPIAGTEQYTVHIAAPDGVPPGSYGFRLDMVGVENPDELFTQGPTVSFEVSEAPSPKPFPWWAIIVAVAGLILCCGVAIGGYFVYQNLTAEKPTPTIEATAAATETPAPTLAPTPFGGGTGRVLFVRGTTLQNTDLWVVTVDGPGSERLTFIDEFTGWPAWSPDGQRIAFVRRPPGAKSDIYLIDANGTNEDNLTEDPLYEDAEPAWSPDGTRIAFSSTRGDGSTVQIHVMNADGSGVEQLTYPSGFNSSPSWSPDGERIVFASNRTGQFEIYIMDVGGGSQTPRTDSGRNLEPEWSPDGEKIAFYHTETDGTNSVWVMNSDGTGLTRLMEKGLQPHWSPDGTQIVFSSGGSGDFDLYVMNADGTGKRLLTNTSEHDAFPAWEPRPAP